MPQPIYLDYAAATPLDPEVYTAMEPFLREQYFNPSATYQAAHAVRQALEQARAQVAHWLGSRTSEVIFTAGGTEANNLAIQGIMRRYPEANLVVSSVEHESVLVPAAQHNHRLVTVGADGRINLDDLQTNIDENTVLVSMMYANNEVGMVQPLREASRIIEAVRHQRRAAGNSLPIYLHTDACQAANYLDLHVARLGVDLLTLNAGKIYGPKQSGVLYLKGGIVLQPVISGGGQERGLRSGTENVAAAVGLAAALDKAQNIRHDEGQRLHVLQQEFYEQLHTQLPKTIINGSQKQRLPNNVHLTLPGEDNERLLFALDEAGILAAAGSACTASNEEPSHVLRAMGLSDSDAQSSLRFTMGRQTTSKDITQTVSTLARLVTLT